MRDDVTTAKELLRSLNRIEMLRHAILNMDAATIAEIRRYASPPKLVHEVMIVSLLILGDDEGKTRVRAALISNLAISIHRQTMAD